MLVALTFACAASCVVLVLAEWRSLAAVRVGAKLAASAAFVLLGLEAFRIGHDPARIAFGQWIFVGLVLGAIGDAALLGRGKRVVPRRARSRSCSATSATSRRRSCSRRPRTGSRSAGLLVSLPVAAGALALALLWPRLGAMKLPVIAYVLTIVTMVIAAIAIARGTTLPTPQRLRFVAGAVLFFVSDLAVARDRFVGARARRTSCGACRYYAGQLLIAWSVIGL